MATWTSGDSCLVTARTQRVHSHVIVYLAADSCLSQDGEKYGVIERGGVFHAAALDGPVSKRIDGRQYEGLYFFAEYQPDGVIHTPIHPSMTLDDVEGATHAEDDGTHWHIGHASAGSHNDLEAIAEALLLTHWQPRINAAISKAIMAADVTARTLAHNKMQALTMFSAEGQTAIQTALRSRTLGHHVREQRHTDYRRQVVVAACRTVLAAWKEAAKSSVVTRAAVALIEPDVNKLIAELTAAPTYRTRAAKAAADAAAAEAAKKAAETAAAEQPAGNGNGNSAGEGNGGNGNGSA